MRTVRFKRVVAAGAGVVALILGVTWWTLAERRHAPIGVVIVTLDTTRADRLSSYGFMNVSLPHVERLAREGVVFDQATSVAPLTLPAHATIFTGLLPPNHRVRDNADAPLTDSATTLAETLAAHGFRTGAFVGSIVLDPERGLNQGFEEYVGVGKTDDPIAEARQRRADEVMNDAIRWLDTTAGSRFFLWTHLYDPHRPYDPPEPFATTYGHNPYVGEIAFADSQIGQLLRALEERQLLDRTVVVVAGDHGESLGEHGERDHGIFVYENVLRVPLIIRSPSVRPTRVGEVVRLTDIMPTVLDLLGVPASGGDGVSLVDVMNERGHVLNLEAYSESLYPQRLGWSPLYALRNAQFKFVDAPRPELYDLLNDPFEERNIYSQHQALAAKMKARARDLAKGPATKLSASRTLPAPEWRGRLATLGYVAAGPLPEMAGEPLPDPKDCLQPDTTVSRVPANPRCGAGVPMDGAVPMFPLPGPR